MAKFNLQEMYLTEYNRLIQALKYHFTALQSGEYNTIEKIVDWLNANKDKEEITSIDLNSIAFSSGAIGTTTNYTSGGNTITLTKHDKLAPDNIKMGVTIEGIAGNVVDGSVIIKLSELSTYGGLTGLKDSLKADIPYYYYDASSSSIKSITGTAHMESDVEFDTTDLPYSNTDQEFAFDSSNVKKNYYYKNFKLNIPKLGITDTEASDVITLTAGYLSNNKNISRLTTTDKNFLKEHLEYGTTLRGVTGVKSVIIDTSATGVGDSNHIASGQKYFKNGVAYEGTLGQLNTSNLIKVTDTKYDTTKVPVVSTTAGEYTTIHIPNYIYNNTEDIYYDITDLRPENIRDDKTIMGIRGSAHMYDTYTGSTTVTLGATSPSSLPTKETMLEEDIKFEIDSSVITPSNIRYGKTILGKSGSFTNSTDGKVTYIDYINTLKSGTDNNGNPIEYFESDNVANGTFAYIGGQLCRGTNTALELVTYTGTTDVVLGATMPSELATNNTKLTSNITFRKDPDIIKQENITYGKTILGVEGTFSKHEGDNKITADSVLKDYIGFVNGERIKGEIETFREEQIPSSLAGATLPTGYYNAAYIKPITFKSRDGGVYSTASDTGRAAIASMLQYGCELYTGRAGANEKIIGDAHLVLSAPTTDAMLYYLNNAERNEIVKYTGTDTATYKSGRYYEIVTEEEAGLVPGSTIPTYDPLFKARELTSANIEAGDVLEGKIGYGYRGEEITGNIKVYDQDDVEYSISLDPTDDIWSSSTPYRIQEAVGYYKDGWKVSVDQTKINPSTIIKDTTIFGVTGTYEQVFGTFEVNVPGTNYGTDANGFMVSEYTIDEDGETGVDAWNKIIIHSKIKGKVRPLTGNGTYDISTHKESGESGWNSVTVAVPLEGELDTWVTSPEQTFTFRDHKAVGETNAAWQTVKVKVPLHDNVAISSNTTWEPVGTNPSGISYIGASKVVVNVPYDGTGNVTASQAGNNAFEFDSSKNPGYVAWTKVNVNVPILTGNTLTTNNHTYNASDIAGGIDYIGYDNFTVSVPVDGTLTKILTSKEQTFTFSVDRNPADTTNVAWTTVNITAPIASKVEVTENGPVTIPSGCIGLGEVIVNVPATVPNVTPKEISLQEIIKKEEINATGIDGWNKITFGNYNISTATITKDHIGQKLIGSSSSTLWKEIDLSGLSFEGTHVYVAHPDGTTISNDSANALWSQVTAIPILDKNRTVAYSDLLSTGAYTVSPGSGTCGLGPVTINIQRVDKAPELTAPIIRNLEGTTWTFDGGKVSDRITIHSYVKTALTNLSSATNTISSTGLAVGYTAMRGDGTLVRGTMAPIIANDKAYCCIGDDGYLKASITSITNDSTVDNVQICSISPERVNGSVTNCLREVNLTIYDKYYYLDSSLMAEKTSEYKYDYYPQKSLQTTYSIETSNGSQSDESQSLQTEIKGTVYRRPYPTNMNKAISWLQGGTRTLPNGMLSVYGNTIFVRSVTHTSDTISFTYSNNSTVEIFKYNSTSGVWAVNDAYWTTLFKVGDYYSQGGNTYGTNATTYQNLNKLLEYLTANIVLVHVQKAASDAAQQYQYTLHHENFINGQYILAGCLTKDTAWNGKINTEALYMYGRSSNSEYTMTGTKPTGIQSGLIRMTADQTMLQIQTKAGEGANIYFYISWTPNPNLLVY